MTIFDRVCRWIAYRMPRCVVYWVTVRVFAEVSTGVYSDKIAGEITIFDAQEAWDR